MRLFSILLLAGLTLPFSFKAQTVINSWTPVNEQNIRVNGTRQIVPQKYFTIHLKLNELKTQLKTAPHEKQIKINNSPSIIYLPLPNGTFERFKVVESPVMADALATAYPEIKTFSIKGIDDAYANGKIDFNEFGFHAMVLSVNGDFFIDPYSTGNTSEYISYYTSDFVKNPAHVLPEVGVIGMKESRKKPSGTTQQTEAKSSMPPAICVGPILRKYDLAIACTGEYAKAATGLTAPTVAQTLAKIVTSVNRVDGVYEKEVSVRMVLVPTETTIIFVDPATDPFTGNNNSGTLLGESQSVINATIGSGNYDIGHTFSTGGGGLANFGCVCDNSNKAKGITGSPSPVGDPYDIDYVAHEMGHQFRASHTFNAITGSCNGNRNSSAAVEPGSGVTIMAYAGICGSNDIIANSIPYFHAISYDEIVNFVHSGGAGGCSTVDSSGNQSPVVYGSGDYTIPKSTPFSLTGGATDPDGDALTYSWEETDLATASGNWNSGKKPYFRSYTPTITPTRLFPAKNVAFSGNFTGTKGEYLPSTAQLLRFRLTARDNKMGGGGVCYAINEITVDTSGPFKVTYPDAPLISWFSGSDQLVTWDVNFTNWPPVSCDSVRILITLNNGTTYSVLTNSTENDGVESVKVPTVTNTVTTCRIRIESKGNIFYDMSNNLFTISIDPNVGINNISRNNPVGLMAWPNPFNDKITLKATGLNRAGPTTITITDLLGKNMLNYTFTGNSELTETIDLSELSEGVYFIKLNNAHHQAVYRALKK